MIQRLQYAANFTDQAAWRAMTLTPPGKAELAGVLGREFHARRADEPGQGSLSLEDSSTLRAEETRK